MNVIHWILGIVAAILATGTALTFIAFIVSGDDLWVKRARMWRRQTSAILLFWFNLWLWRHVILIIIHW